MPIWNLTTEDEEKEPTVYDLLGYPDVRCYKGDRKTGAGENTRPGKDLKDKIRVVTGHRQVGAILTDCYNVKPVAAVNADPFAETSAASPQGDWQLEQLNIYLALDDADLTFETAMKPFDGSGASLVCDRRRISKEAVTIQTHKGQRRVMKNCDKPCALAESDPDDWDCPLGCKPSGILHFYVRECFDLDVMVHAQFETKAKGDVPNLMKRLRAIKKEFGSLTRSPYPCYWTRHRIPLVLSRVSRKRSRPDVATKMANGKKKYEFTGKKATGEFYDLDLQVDPVWADWHRKQKLLEEMLARGLTPGKNVVAGLMTGDSAIDVKAIAASIVQHDIQPNIQPNIQPDFEPAPEIFSDPEEVQPAVDAVWVKEPDPRSIVTEDMIVQLEDILISNSWSEDAIARLLTQHNLQDNPRQMTKEQWLELSQIAANPQAAREYNDEALAPGTVTVMPDFLTPEIWGAQVHPVFKQHGWVLTKPDGKADNSRIFAMLQNEYGITKASELLVSQISEILELAASDAVRDRWVKQS